MHSDFTPFDPFLRVAPKSIRQTSYDWLVDNVKSHDNDACLVWPFATNKKGFGILKVKGTGASTVAHRVAFELATGRTPKACVIQTCEDRLCCAPQHLEERGHSRAAKTNPRPFLLYEWAVKQITGHHSDECLIWPYAVSGPMGYGTVRCPISPRRNEYVHRLAFFLVQDHWPYPQTLHSCDNPRCFNPYHLSEGTKDDNTQDMVRKGRARSPALRGTDHGRAKLTEQQVLAIRSRYAIGDISMEALGAEFEVSAFQIFRIVRRKVWTHI